MLAHVHGARGKHSDSEHVRLLSNVVGSEIVVSFACTHVLGACGLTRSRCNRGNCNRDKDTQNVVH